MIISTSIYSNKLTKDELNERQEAVLAASLVRLYQSFAKRPGNEYAKIQDAIAAVLDKIDAHDHCLAYTGKLVLFIEARHALRGLYLTPEQNDLIVNLREMSKHVNPNYVYIDKIDGSDQFTR